MSRKEHNTYLRQIGKANVSGQRNEGNRARHFANLIESYSLPRNLHLTNEYICKGRYGNSIRLDGALIDSLNTLYGVYEAKDEKDDLNKEVKIKLEQKGYPNDNFLIENGIEAWLFRGSDTPYAKAEIQSYEQIDQLLKDFVSYETNEVKEFLKAVDLFSKDIPLIVAQLRQRLDKAHSHNATFLSAFRHFLELCQSTIHASVTVEDVNEMLIQHILTEEIFSSIFGERHFHSENNIAKVIQTVERAFLDRKEKKELLASVQIYYDKIKKNASAVYSHDKKQWLLKGVYEQFYKVYNPKAADRLGVVYTPNEIVRFMIETTDTLLERHFQTALSQKGVEILDPCVGTGTFIVDLLDYIPKHYLKYKYLNEIHANELSILPYYIANLNIEYTYQEKTGEFNEFPNLCFVDTLDNTGGTKFKGKQENLFNVTEENAERVKRQNERKISVIIGNPPYNANQQNENDNNKNRVYPDVDKRIKETYIKNSTAQKTKLYDMYVRFIRWASDRLADEGIIAFITNRSYIDSRTFDGFRKVVTDEFSEIYIIDTRSDVRMNPKIAGTTHNVFGIQTGVAVIFLVKKKRTNPNALTTPNPSLKGGELHNEFPPLKGGELHNESRTQKGGELHNEFPPLKGGDRGGKKEGAGKEVRGEEKPPCKIFYHTLTDEQLKAEKLEWFSSTKFENLPFDRIFPDSKHNWLNLTDNDWDTLIPVCDRVSQETIFEFHSLGVSTNRDEWVFDISRENLEAKMRFFVESYNAQMEQAKGVTDWDKYEWGTTVKWSNTLKNYFMGRNSLSLINDLTKAIYYRPFVKLYYYAQKQLSDRLTQNHYDMFGQNFELDNLTLTIMGKDTPKPFSILMTNYLSCVNYLSPAAGTYLFPLYRYERDGSRVENVSEWALGLFRERYGISPIKVELEGVKKTTPNPSLKGGELHNESHTQKGGEHVARFPPFQGGIKGGEKWDRENLPREVSNLKHLKETRKELRSNATPAEATLWKSLQKNQLQGRKFRRQHSIGNYIADFYCSEEKLVIELDGAEHFTSQGSAYDAKRTEFMNQYGVRVLRFENKDVFESLDAVLKVIQDAFTIQKEDIFYYVYGVLHCPAYRTKYEQNLKRDFPRIPLYDDFWQWAGWGRQLADLHLNFETVAPYPLTRVEKEVKPKQNAMFADDKPLPKKPAIAKLKADKAKGEIILDTETTLTGIPADAWEYKLGNRSALEWILDQYKESTPTDPTIREKFNTYRFADYKEKVIDLLCRVCTVSVETMKIVKAMPRE